MDFLNILKTNGLKATPQRVGVLRELGKKTHPTMEEIYSNIKEVNPSISLATVYKNVNLLRENGLVTEINIPNGKMRYDYISTPHTHIVCNKCGNLEDLHYDENLLNFKNSLEEKKDIKIDRLDVVVSLESCSCCK